MNIFCSSDWFRPNLGLSINQYFKDFTDLNATFKPVILPPSLSSANSIYKV